MRTQTARLGMMVVLLCCGLPAGATAFYPETLQAPDGAMTLNPGGNYVEPYFATKALIVAQDGGLDVRDAAAAWIRWVLPRQQPDGPFRRFCRVNRGWRALPSVGADASIHTLSVT